MLQPGILMPSGPIFDLTFSNQYVNCNQEMEFCDIDYHDFSSSFASHSESSVISSNSCDQTMFQDEFLIHHIMSSSMEGVETIFSSEDLMEVCEWINETDHDSPSGDQESSPCISFESDENSDVGLSLSLPETEMELDDELRLHHLLKAYAEAMENGEKDLADVLAKSTNEKTSAMGSTMERVAFSLFRYKEKQTEQMQLESINNLVEAFRVLYQGLPVGRFAHLTANSAIIGAMPSDADLVHVIDFDIGEGIQWAPLMESLSWKNKSLMLTSVKLDGERTSTFCNIEETKKRLQGHAKQYNCRLQVEEKSMEDLVNELTRRMKKRGEEKNWLVFNCMVGLPHMARRRPRSQVLEFLKVAKELLSKFAGILTLGDGEEGYGLNTCSSYQSFFDKLLRHYQALFESLEKNLPSYLAAARTTIESLFLAPFLSPFDWFQDWEEKMKSQNVQDRIGLEGLELSKESLAEAREMVNEREGPFKVKVEGYREHEMVLEWKDTPLVRVSTWM
ncbi:nodulation-signaling pathway 2 protein-like [Dorcoceras hygrometricum]|uniref:Nodulation-signaling pathway 2 protein-like n=1 Tax=Dorcoceras hygrometricum TaxID=472368 RepID=A0A2Z7A221_9LAMI|nr:nodulation-signaling pathway 2 protein-like [Dorcoceras hygrometricum]